MAKVIDITDKLKFDENPRISLNGKEYEVNADAETVLKVMGAVKSGSYPQMIGSLYLMFNEEDLQEICAMKKGGKKLSGKALTAILNTAVGLVMNNDDEEEGEQ